MTGHGNKQGAKFADNILTWQTLLSTLYEEIKDLVSTNNNNENVPIKTIFLQLIVDTC